MGTKRTHDDVEIADIILFIFIAHAHTNTRTGATTPMHKCTNQNQHQNVILVCKCDPPRRSDRLFAAVTFPFRLSIQLLSLHLPKSSTIRNALQQ